MLHTERMSKISITGTKTVIDKVIAELHLLKILHIIDHQKTQQADIGSPLQKADAVSEVLVLIRGIINTLNINKKIEISNEKYDHFISKNDLNTFIKKKKAIQELHQHIIDDDSQRKANEDRMRILQENKNILDVLKFLPYHIEQYSETNTLSFILGSIKHQKHLHHELNKVSTRFELHTAAVDKKEIIALFMEKKERQKFMEALAQFGFSEISLQQLEAKKGNVHDVLKKVEKEIETLKHKNEAVIKKQQKLALEWDNFLLAAEKELQHELHQLEAPLKFAATDAIFAVEGFVPTKQVDYVKERLEKIAKGKIYLKTEELKKNEKIPIKLDHPKKVMPFEFLMHMYTLPDYKEIDPTFFLFLTFPLFFGFMLGDIGYGIVTLLFFLWLRKKVPSMVMLIDILIFSSISSIFFGFIFGEFFGAEEIGSFAIPHLLSRIHDINTLLYIAVAIGFVHLNIGLIIGFINELHHGLKKAIFAKGAWFVLETAAALIALAYMQKIPLSPIVGFILLGIAIVMLYLGEGVAGMIEIPGIFSNMLSYARLMALGVASVSLAIVVNEFAFESFHSGIVGIITGVLILIIGHVINIGLGLLGPFLHSLRLHYVEFFSKFYKGGGKEYVPFGA